MQLNKDVLSAPVLGDAEWAVFLTEDALGADEDVHPWLDHTYCRHIDPILSSFISFMTL